MIAQEINKLADKFAGMGVHDDYDPMDTSNLADGSVVFTDENGNEYVCYATRSVKKKVNNEDEDRKIAIAKMMAQKQISKKSGPVVRKKVSIKKPAVKQIIQPKLSDDEKFTELQNFMELIDIKGII